MVQNSYKNFIKHVGLPKRAWQGHALYLLQHYYRRTIEYFCMIPFASSRQWSKIVINFFSSMPIGRGRATPIFDFLL